LKKTNQLGLAEFSQYNGIEWIDTREINGISSFEELQI
jgi:hypothetical protein